MVLPNMSKINPKRAHAAEIFEGFPGMGSAALGSRQATVIQNFRILSDGSLQKRSGSAALFSFSDPVRGFWEGSLDGVFRRFAVTGKNVFRIDSDAMRLVTVLSAESGRVSFFLFRGFLYLCDGSTILVYRQSTASFSEARGYAPLYGKNWHPSAMGDINEPLNLISGRLRIHYFNTSGSMTFSLPFYADSIDQVRADGLLTSAFSLDSGRRSFTLSTAAVPSSIEVAFTISIDSELHQQLRQITRVCLSRDGESERLAAYGSPVGNRLFATSEVDDNMLFASSAAYSDSDPLYFRAGNCLTLGDEDHPLTTLFLDRERILAFHKAGAYAVSFSESGESLSAYPLLRGVGCAAVDAALYLEGDCVVVNESGIFRLRSTASEPDEFEVIALSEGVEALRGESFAQNVLVAEDRGHGELWFCDGTAAEGSIYCYHRLKKVWYCFDGIVASFFFPHGDGVGFANGNRLFVFDESLTTDDGRVISASFQSASLLFGDPEEAKRGLRITLCASGTTEAVLTLESESRTKTLPPIIKRSEAPVLLDRRAALGRFRLLRVTLRDDGRNAVCYHRLALFAAL